MNISPNLKYTAEHEWVRIEADGTVYVGFTNHAQNQLGEITYVDINTKGKAIAKGNIFGAVEAVKTVSDLLMPVSGEIIDANEALSNAPELINTDPYGEGWIIRIKPSNLAELNSLLNATEYKKLVG